EKARTWDPRQEMTVANTCRIPSIVYALQGPFPIEIFQGRDLIVMRLEYFDMARVFFLDDRFMKEEEAPNTKTGYSRAHWEGDELVVVTTRLKEATITNNGLDHSEQMRVTERYRLKDDGRTLMVAQEYEDPLVLENRGVRYIGWRKVVGDHVRAYGCDPTFAEEYASPCRAVRGVRSGCRRQERRVTPPGTTSSSLSTHARPMGMRLLSSRWKIGPHRASARISRSTSAHSSPVSWARVSRRIASA